MRSIKNALLLAALCSSLQGFAREQSVVGTWILEKSDNPLPDGTVVPYCTGVHGMIIYTDEGYMSVALNCGPKEGDGEEPADISGRKFLYAGTYEYDGTQVTHHLLNASQPELIGKSFVRDVSNDGSTLVLSGENQGQVFSATWKRVKPQTSGK